MKNEFSNLLLDYNKSARHALRRLNELGDNDISLFIYKKSTKSILGTITDGDLRRGLLQNLQIDEPVTLFMNKNFKYFADDKQNISEYNKVKNLNIRLVPVLDKEKRFVKIIDISKINAIIPLDAIIIAGGKGERLRPLTNTTPKPLLKVGDKAIIEHIVDRLINFGIKDIHISIGYLGQQIIKYLGNGKSKGINISYVDEQKPMGTIGSVSNIYSINNESVLLMNSDLLTNINIVDFYEEYVNSKADMIVATVPYQVQVPYAVMEVSSNNKKVIRFKEKPRYTYYSNAGIYIFKKELLKFIPRNTKFDTTEFMQLLIDNKHKVISYPLVDYWLDIGRMEDYIKAQRDIKHLFL